MFRIVMVVRPSRQFRLEQMQRTFDSYDAACEYAARITASSGGYFAVEIDYALND